MTAGSPDDRTSPAGRPGGRWPRPTSTPRWRDTSTSTAVAARAVTSGRSRSPRPSCSPWSPCSPPGAAIRPPCGTRESAESYATSARERIEAEQLYLRSGQVLAYDAGTFNAWLQATVKGEEELANVLERRFTPEYKVAFDAWLELDPSEQPRRAGRPGPHGRVRGPGGRAVGRARQAGDGDVRRGRPRQGDRRQLRAHDGHPGGRPLPHRRRPALRRQGRAHRRAGRWPGSSSSTASCCWRRCR